jgi:SnoaL-like domain
MAAGAAQSEAHPLRVAMETRDFDAVARALAPDVVLHSPITASFTFRGRDEVRSLLENVRGVFDELHYVHDFGSRELRVLVFEARVGRERIEGADTLLLDEEGLVREITVFIRPLPGLVAFAATLAPQLAGRNGRWRSSAVAAALGPLAVMTRVGDVPISRLVTGKKIRRR